MKVAALALGFAALALGAFAVWTFGYRTTGDGTGQLARAWTDAQEFQLTYGYGQQYSVGAVHDVRKVSDGLYVARFDPGRSTGVSCWAFDLGSFQTEPGRGVGRVPCKQ